MTKFKKINIFYNNYIGFYDYNYKSIEDNQIKTTITIEKKLIRKKKTFIYNLRIDFNFLKASQSSLIFLNCYRLSENIKFVLSPFRYLIQFKWEKIKKWFILLGFIFGLHIWFFSLYLLYSDIMIYFILDIIIIFLLIIYEILQIITVLKFYSKKLSFLEITLFLLDFSVLIMNYNKNKINARTLSSFNMICIIIIFSRGLLHLQVFDTLRHLINMILSVCYSRYFFNSFYFFLYY